MKLFYPFFALFLCSFATIAQNFSVPRDEFAIILPNIPVQIHRGESTTLTLSILKAKGFAKAKTILQLNSVLPKGISIKISPETGVFDTSAITITASEEAQVGKATLNITAEMRHIKKGLITSFEIL
jgi:hypothetical protein